MQAGFVALFKATFFFEQQIRLVGALRARQTIIAKPSSLSQKGSFGGSISLNACAPRAKIMIFAHS
jgi:hypothetical protein